MRFLRLPPCSVAVLASLTCVSACAPREPAAIDNGRPAPVDRFTAEDRRVAQALSVWKRQSAPGETAQDRAAMCELAVAAMTERLEGAKLLSAEQTAAVARAKAIFTARRRQGNPSEEELRATMQKAEETLPDQPSRLRQAVQCLRELA